MSNNWKIHSDPWSILLLWMRLCHPRYPQGILQPPSSTPLLWDLSGRSTHQPKASKNYTNFIKDHPNKILQNGFTFPFEIAVSIVSSQKNIKKPSNATNSALLHDLQPPLYGTQLCPVPLKQLIPARRFPVHLVVGTKNHAENPTLGDIVI